MKLWISLVVALVFITTTWAEMEATATTSMMMPTQESQTSPTQATEPLTTKTTEPPTTKTTEPLTTKTTEPQTTKTTEPPTTKTTEPPTTKTTEPLTTKTTEPPTTKTTEPPTTKTTEPPTTKTTEPQTTKTTEPPTIATQFCGNVSDKGDCKKNYSCVHGSCFCYNEKPLCRCDNYNNEWYLGEKCTQKWTLTQFALVASLPGIAMAVIVGVAVHLVHMFRKPKHHEKDVKGTKKEDKFSGTNSKYGSIYENPAFSSDLRSNEKPFSGQNPMMKTSVYSNSLYSRQPAGANQSYDNPYNKAGTNPYEYESTPPNRFDDYRTTQQSGISRGFPQASLKSSYSASVYSTRPQFPRAQTGSRY